MGRNTLNIYLIKQRYRAGYDTYDSAVVVAEDEDEAKRIHPNEVMSWNEKEQCFGGFWKGEFRKERFFPSWAEHIDQVEVIYLGEAEPTISGGTICASFNAG